MTFLEMRIIGRHHDFQRKVSVSTPLRLAALLGLVSLGLPVVGHAQGSGPKWYDRVSFNGDFRLRGEGFFQRDEPNRVRLRIRLRAGVTIAISDHFTTGFRMATGAPGAVTSANLTLGNGFVGESFTLDRAYLTWRPSRRFEATAGKFGMPFHRPAALLGSELAYDDEVPPEGLRQQLVVLERLEGLVRKLTLSADQWILRESRSGDDTWMLGGQALMELVPSTHTRLDLAGAFMNWAQIRPMATLANSNKELVISNSVVTKSRAILEGGSPLTPSTSDPFAEFANDFRIATLNAGLTVDSVGGRPLVSYVDLVRNTALGSNNSGIWVGASWGQVRRQGDWAIGAAWTRLEREAVLSMFSYSDLGLGGTNVQGPIFQFTWRPVRELTLQAKHHIVQSVLPVPGFSGTLHRLQLDGRVSF